MIETLEQLTQYFDEHKVEGTGYFTEPSYVTAIVGMTQDERLVYDYDKMVEFLMRQDEISNEEAIASLGGKCEMEGEYNWWSMYVTIEMVHSDEWGVLKGLVEPQKEAALCYELAKAKLLDKDELYNVRTYFQL